MAGVSALEQFGSSVRIAEELLRIERENYSDPPKEDEQQAVEGLRGGAAVLMVAGFESFLRQSIEEHLTKLTEDTASVPFDNLPSKMQIHSVFTTLEYATKGFPYEESRRKIDRLPDIEEACKIVLSKSLNPRAFSHTRSNPNSNTVKEIFKTLEVSDVFGRIRTSFEKSWGQTEADTFLADKLDEIVNRRHVVAHTANALNITRVDLDQAVRFLRNLTVELDRHIEDHINSILRSHMTP